METPEQQIHSHYRIRVKEQLDPSWQQWFSGLELRREASGATSLSGRLSDQAALYGVLLKITRLGLTLLSVEPLEIEQNETERPILE